MQRKLALLLIILSIALVSRVARAQWRPDGIGVSIRPNYQTLTKIVPDGAGGAILVWEDYRNGSSNSDIYAQRLDASGVTRWTDDGLAVSTAVDHQRYHTIVSDGAGGAIITWQDNRGGIFADIYAQRVNAAGVALWTANGVVISTAADDQYEPKIAPDGVGGAIITWSDYRSGTNYDVYAQRVNSSGSTLWTANGVAISTAASTQGFPVIVSDGASGAIVTWHDFRSGMNWDIYAQRVNAAGVVQWIANGVALSTAANDQTSPVISEDGFGGAVVAWPDTRSGSFDIYAQRVNAAGVVQWVANGLAVTNAVNNQSAPQLASDGSGGAIVVWDDPRNGVKNDVYAQRVSAAGVPQWAIDGVALSIAPDHQIHVTIVPDGAKGAIVAWTDYRNGFADIYAQKVSAAGVPQWIVDGAAVSTAPNDQVVPAIVLSGGGAILVWGDSRSGGDPDVYAQRVDLRHARWGHPEPVVTSVADVPNDQGGKVAINWTASEYDLPAQRTIGHYTIWRAVDALPMAGDGFAELTDLARVGRDSHGPIYTQLPASDYYWELVGTQSAHAWAGYSFSAPTRADSVAGDTGDGFFMVAAHDQWDDYVAFASNVGGGHSVDNLAPLAPFLLVAQRVGADVQLHWNRAVAPDLRDYAVYRATSSGVTPVPINFLTNAEDTVAVDANAPSSALYYIVTAYDVHANQSDPSNEAAVGALTGIGDTPALTALTVMQNHPNPFNTTTDFEIGLPSNADVTIDVFDVAGRKVSGLEVNGAKAGWNRIPFAGRDEHGRPLVSGVYFYRVKAAGTTMTKKMVISR